MILGDFNGHLQMLEENRRDDRNGIMIQKWMENYNLVLLNADEKCEGIYTRSRGGSKSAIDMVLMNEDMYNWCEKMEIDEKKEVINISDHCLINVKCNIRGKDKNKFRKIEWEEEEYYRKDQEAMEEFKKEMMEKWRREK